MQYMVCRKDAVEGTMKTSALFPVIIEAGVADDYGDIALRAMQKRWPGYIPSNKSYYVIPLVAAKIVTFRPKRDYDVTVEEV